MLLSNLKTKQNDNQTFRPLKQVLQCKLTNEIPLSLRKTSTVYRFGSGLAEQKRIRKSKFAHVCEKNRQFCTSKQYCTVSIVSVWHESTCLRRAEGRFLLRDKGQALMMSLSYRATGCLHRRASKKFGKQTKEMGNGIL